MPVLRRQVPPFRIVERPVVALGLMHRAERLDREAIAARFLGGQIGESNAAAERVAEAGTGRDRDRLAMPEDRFAAIERRPAIRRKDGEPASRSLLLDALERGGTEKIALAERHAKSEPGLVGVIVGRQLRTPIEIPFFQSKAF